MSLFSKGKGGDGAESGWNQDQYRKRGGGWVVGTQKGGHGARREDVRRAERQGLGKPGKHNDRN